MLWAVAVVLGLLGGPRAPAVVCRRAGAAPLMQQRVFALTDIPLGKVRRWGRPWLTLRARHLRGGPSLQGRAE